MFFLKIFIEEKNEYLCQQNITYREITIFKNHYAKNAKIINI